MRSSVPGMLAVTLFVVGLFSFLSVLVWAHERRREREAYYRNETLRRIAETGNAARDVVLGVIDADERHAARRRLEARKLSGIITLSVGIAMMVFIRAVEARNPEPSYLVGLIPTFVGASLLFYVYILAPGESPRLPKDAPGS